MVAKYKISRLGHQGDGIADGPIYVPRTLPGEVVSGTQDGTLLCDVRIETPSSDRVQPPCRHYKSCGGCQLQHASDAFVANWKQQVVETALSAQNVRTVFRPIITSPACSRRRAAISVRRTKKGALAGFHARASDVIIPIPDCQLLDPRLAERLSVAEAFAQLGASRKSELSVLMTISDAGLDIAVAGGKPLDGQLRMLLAQAAEQHDLARLSWGDEIIAMRRPPIQKMGQASVAPPPGAFLQATPQGEAALVSAVWHIAQGADNIVDLFAGCGTFSLPLAETAEVHAVEGDDAMMAALDHGWRNAKGLKRVSTETRDLFRRPLMPDELDGFDLAVLDPPRAGAQAQVSEIVQSGILRIAYVSCNPISFAKDANDLVRAGYQLEWVQVVDQFRWSTHIELVASFVRNGQKLNKKSSAKK